MTSAPVKDVNSLINFVGGNNSTKAGSANQAGSFGDLMSKTQSNLAGGQRQLMAAEVTKPSTADLLKNHTETLNASQPVKDSVKTQQPSKDVNDSKAVKDVEVTDDRADAVQDAGKEVVKEVAKELGVSEEEVEQAMKELGFSACSLFDPANMAQLLLQLSGENEAALLTDESLLASLQNLTEMAAGIMEQLTEEAGLTPEEMNALLEEIQKRLGGTPDATQEQPRITVEVKDGDDTVKLEADENGNAIKTLDVESPKTENNSENQTGGQEKKGGEGREQENALHAGNSLNDAMLQNNAQVSEASFEQTVPHFSEQTQDIMNQILDYMKLQLRPGMDQLEMQLHPASLGTVHIQIVSRGGEITAQFHVQNETVKAALESQISTLQENLREQGVKVEAVSVTVESHGFESNLWQGQERNDSASAKEGKKAPRRINLNELDVDGMSEEQASEEDLLAARMMEANGNTVDYTA